MFQLVFLALDDSFVCVPCVARQLKGLYASYVPLCFKNKIMDINVVTSCLVVGLFKDTKFAQAVVVNYWHVADISPA